MKTKIVQDERVDIAYVHPGNGDMGMFLSKLYLHEGYFVFHIPATYGKTLPFSHYYFVAKNERDAKKRFKAIHGSKMSVIGKIEKVDDELRDELLNDPFHRAITW